MKLRRSGSPQRGCLLLGEGHQEVIDKRRIAAIPLLSFELGAIDCGWNATAGRESVHNPSTMLVAEAVHFEPVSGPEIPC
jgi:hypothetical protein